MGKILRFIARVYTLLAMILCFTANALFAQSTATSGGFTVTLQSNQYNSSANTTTFVYYIKQTGSTTGISHMDLASFCLSEIPTSLDVSNDGVNWTASSVVYTDGSAPACQLSEPIIKMSGNGAYTDNYFRLTLSGRFDAAVGNGMFKFGNGTADKGGNGYTTTGCSNFQVLVPLKVSNYHVVDVCQTTNPTRRLSAAAGAGSYTWKLPNGTTTTSGNNYYDISESPASSGLYHVTFTLNGCKQEEEFMVSINTLPSASASAIAAKCKNGATGAINLTVTGGTPSYTYAWSNAASSQNLNGVGAGSYNVTVTDSKGCQATASATVTEPALLTASASTAANVSCKNGSNGAVNLTAGGGVAPYSYSWSNSAATQNISSVVAGSYNVTVTDANGCTAAASATVTEPALLTASASTAANVSCKKGSNGAVNLTAGGGTAPYSYSWSNGGTTQNISSLTAGTYNVTVTDAHGCTATASATVSEPELLTASASTAANVSCKNGSNGAVNLAAGGGTAPYSFAWSNGAADQNISSLIAGTYSVTVTDAHGCTATASATVTEPELLTASASTAANVSCKNGSNGAVNLAAGGGTAPYRFAWSNGGTIQNISSLTAGSYNVTVTDAHGCTATASATVTEPELLTASASTAANVSCKGGSNGGVNLTVAGGTADYTYVWNNGANTQNISSLIAGTYNVTVTDAHGCTATASATVSEPELLTASASTAANVSCKGGSNGGVNLAVAGGTADYTYAWSNGANTQNISSLIAGTYNVTVTDAHGCTATASATVSEPELLTASASTAANVSCKGGSNGGVNLAVAGGTADYTYAWSNGANTQNISSLIAGTYNVTVTDAHGCTATASATVTEPELLTASASTAANVSCKGGSNGGVNLTVAGGTADYTYAWSNGANTQNISSLIAGTYNVTVTDAHGCTATASATVSEPELLTASASTAANVSCKGGSNGGVNLAVAGGTADYTYAWSNGANTHNISSLSAGSYSVTVTDAHGCVATASATVTEPELLTASASTAANVSCKNGSNGGVNLAVGGGTAPYSFAWNNSATDQNISSLTAGTYNVTVTDAHGCVATASAIVTEPELLTVSASTAANVSCKSGSNGAVNLTAGGGTAPYSFAWSNGANTQNISSLSAGSYNVTVTDAHGCSATSSATVTEPELLTASASTAANVSCKNGNNGAVNLSVAGGTAVYAFAWSNGANAQNISSLSAGTYNVTVTDAHGCTATASATVTEPELLTVSASTAANVSCKSGSNGAVNLTAGGGTAPYSFAWSNGATDQNISSLTAGSYNVTVTDSHGCTATASATVTEPELLTVSASTAANVSCKSGSNGAVNLTAGGGTAPYSFAWSNGATDQNISSLTAGSYNVTVTDAHGCTATASATVTEPALLTASASTAANVSCKNGSNGAVNLAVAGGAGSYTFAWSNGGTTQNLAALTAGSYSVTVTDANGCRTTASATVAEPALLTASAVSTAVLCNGGNNGSVNLNITGGTSNYNCAWSNGATTRNLSGVSAGTYSVTVTDANGCTTTAKATVTEPAKIQVSASGPATVCTGNSGTLTAAGGVSYKWSGPNGYSSTAQNPVIANMQAANSGTYSVIVTDANGCSNTATTSVVVKSCLVPGGIYPTEVGPADFNTGTAYKLGSLCLTTKTASGKTTVSNATPGVFFYYTNIVAPSANFSLYVSQTASSALGLSLSLASGYAFVFDNNNNKIATGGEVSSKAGDALINVANAVPGSIITVAVKYDSKSIIGKTVSGALPSTASFATRLGNTVTSPVINGTATNFSLASCSGTILVAPNAITTVNSSVTAEQSAMPEATTELQVTPYPNPYVNGIRFTLKSSVSGAAALEVFDINGRKVAEPFRGNMEAGVSKTATYDVPATITGTLIYRFQVGTKVTQGKILSVH